MIINIIFLQLISFASANPAAQYKEAIEASTFVVDTVLKLSKELKSRTDEVNKQIREERERIKNVADLNLRDFTGKVAIASSKLADAIVAGDLILQSMLELTDNQVQLLEREYQGMRYHPFIVRSAKRAMLTALNLGTEQLTAILQDVKIIKGHMNAIAADADYLHDTIEAEWTQERIDKKIEDWRMSYIGAGALCLLPGGAAVSGTYIAGVEIAITEWKEELELSQAAVQSIKEKFQSLKHKSNELVCHAEKAHIRYAKAVKEMKMTDQVIQNQGVTTEDVDQEEVEFVWEDQVLPQLKQLRQRLADILSSN